MSQGSTRKDSESQKEKVKEKEPAPSKQIAIEKEPEPLVEDENNNEEENFSEVIEFLESVKLAKYKDTFIQNGFDDMDTILELNEEYLESLGLPLGHKLKIMKRIRELRNDDSRPSTVPKTQAYSNEEASCTTEDIKSKYGNLFVYRGRRGKACSGG